MKKILISIIRFYQQHISPATPPSCRYHPTCSSYALEAVDKHGALKGGIMSTARILRCNPFVEGGVDQVPDYFTLGRNPANIGEQYIPAYLLSVDEETKKDIEQLQEKYGEQLKIVEELQEPLTVLEQLVELKELSPAAVEQEFSADELAYLQEIGVVPDLTRADYRYFTLPSSLKNKKYLQEIQSFAEGIQLGEDHPLIVLEQTGIWYTNLPKLKNQFLIERGVTTTDTKNISYHLWIVLKAIEAEAK